MTSTSTLPGRAVGRVDTPQASGGNPQTDKSAMVMPFDFENGDPIIGMVDDWYSTAGFDWHPHRGFETITYVVEGQLEHRDNRGGHGVLEVGDAQYMTAGRGIIHSERAFRHDDGGSVRTLQVWINLPAADKMVEPAYQDLRGGEMPTRVEDGVVVRVFSGASGGVRGPATNHAEITMVDVRVEPNHSVRQEIPGGQLGFVYVLGGSGRFGSEGVPVSAGQVVRLDAIDHETGLDVTAEGSEPLWFVMFTGTPLHEHVVHYGPFVMNTEQQIYDAVADYNAGEFGPIPAV